MSVRYFNNRSCFPVLSVTIGATSYKHSNIIVNKFVTATVAYLLFILALIASVSIGTWYHPIVRKFPGMHGLASTRCWGFGLLNALNDETCGITSLCQSFDK